MQPNRYKSGQARRRFLKKAALWGAAAVFGATGGRRGSAAGPVEPADTATTPANARYRLTDHIRRYYQRAAF